jgi:hypothetical protein
MEPNNHAQATLDRLAGGEQAMFTRRRILATATIVGALAVAGPVVSANAAPATSAGATVAATSGYGGPWNHGIGHGRYGDQGRYGRHGGYGDHGRYGGYGNHGRYGGYGH